MIEMDGRDCAKYQNSGKKGHKWNFGILNDNKDEIGNSDHLLPLFKREKM